LIPNEKSNHYSPTVVGGRRPLPSETCAQSDPPLRKTPTSTGFRLYNVSTVRDSEYEIGVYLVTVGRNLSDVTAPYL